MREVKLSALVCDEVPRYVILTGLLEVLGAGTWQICVEDLNLQLGEFTLTGPWPRHAESPGQNGLL
jgi:hypothetical protein